MATTTINAHQLLRSHNLRDTAPRRMVIAALEALNRPSSHADIVDWLEQNDASVNQVTVYRIIDAFEKAGIVHVMNNGYVLCSIPHKAGHHGLISCESCGKTAEFMDAALCQLESVIARKRGFIPSHRLHEITGLCAACAS